MKLNSMQSMAAAALGCLMAVAPAAVQIREHSLKLAATDSDCATGLADISANKFHEGPMVEKYSKIVGAELAGET